MNLREVKSNLFVPLNPALVGCLLIKVPYFITPSKFSYCQVLGGAFAITQDQSLPRGPYDAFELSVIKDSSALKKQKKNVNYVNVIIDMRISIVSIDY